MEHNKNNKGYIYIVDFYLKGVGVFSKVGQSTNPKERILCLINEFSKIGAKYHKSFYSNIMKDINYTEGVCHCLLGEYRDISVYNATYNVTGGSETFKSSAIKARKKISSNFNGHIYFNDNTNEINNNLSYNKIKTGKMINPYINELRGYSLGTEYCEYKFVFNEHRRCLTLEEKAFLKILIGKIKSIKEPVNFPLQFSIDFKELQDVMSFMKGCTVQINQHNLNSIPKIYERKYITYKGSYKYLPNYRNTHNIVNKCYKYKTYISIEMSENNYNDLLAALNTHNIDYMVSTSKK